MDLTVGSAWSEADQSRLQTVGLQLSAPTSASMVPNSTESFAARSVEGGLLTLAVLGKAALFSQPQASEFSLEIEDLVTLHVTSDSVYAQVNALLGVAGGGFRVVTDLVLNRGSLVAVSALAGLCPTTPGPMTLGACLLRYGIRDRAPVAGLAHEVQPSQRAGAAAFMRGLVGTNDFAGALGANYSDLLVGKYQLVSGGKARRVFWVNPGVKWAAAAAASRFTLSQHVVLVALIHLVTRAGVSRRALLATQAPGPSSGAGSPPVPGASVMAVQYGTSLREIMADALSLPLDHVGWWRITMALAADQACAAPADLMATMQKTFVGYMDKAATAFQEVGIQSVARSAGAAACPGGRQTRLGAGQGAEGSATGTFDTIVAFKTGAAQPSLSVAALLSMPAVLSVVPVTVPEAIGRDSDGAAQQTPPAAIWTPLCAVTAVLIVVLAWNLFLRSNSKSKAKAKGPDETVGVVHALDAEGFKLFSDKQQRSLSRAPKSAAAAQGRGASSEAVEISVALGFLVQGANDSDYIWRSSADPAPPESLDSKVVEDQAPKAQAQAASPSLKAVRDRVRMAQVPPADASQPQHPRHPTSIAPGASVQDADPSLPERGARQGRRTRAA